MRNDSVRLTPRGEIFVASAYAVVRVVAIVVVKLGQVLGII